MDVKYTDLSMTRKVVYTMIYMVFFAVFVVFIYCSIIGITYYSKDLFSHSILGIISRCLIMILLVFGDLFSISFMAMTIQTIIRLFRNQILNKITYKDNGDITSELVYLYDLNKMTIAAIQIRRLLRKRPK